MVPFVRVIILSALICSFATAAVAQEATLAGSVVDATGGVLPGVTITAVNAATGNTFVGVTDGLGSFRIGVRTGEYVVTAELQGFATLTRRVGLLVGQTADVRLQMVPSTVQETVTVTGEAPLLETSSSEIRSSIDPRQMQELPVNGRNWIDLSLMAAGARHNTSSDSLGTTLMGGAYQINIDGLRVTQQMHAGSASFPQPRYSRDAIAEFEVVTNRFDATQGGAMAMEVNAVSKSGTNIMSGSFAGYFRDDRFIAKDFVQNRVLPYTNQQISTTMGGPIRKDRIHFFGNFEYEREPRTIIHTSPFPTFNVDLPTTKIEKKTGGRGDIQFSPQTRMTLRGTWYDYTAPWDSAGGPTLHPSRAVSITRRSSDFSAVLTKVLTSRSVNTLNAGYAGIVWRFWPTIPWAAHPYGLGVGAPSIDLRGYGIGTPSNFPQKPEQDAFSVRDDYSWSYTKGGRHDVKLGGEYRRTLYDVFACFQCGGRLDATGGAIPANIQELLPVWDNPSTWNLAPLASITRFYEQNLGSMTAHHAITGVGAWMQDDWRVARKLTLNLGVRWDLFNGAFAEEVTLPPFLPETRSISKRNIAPRLGIAYTATDTTVIRGGYGVFFSDPGDGAAFTTHWAAQQVALRIPYDGRADFVTNPFNGPTPTYEQAKALLCVTTRRPSCLRRSFMSVGAFTVPDAKVPFSHQGSAGVQRQFGSTVSVAADYTFTLTRHTWDSGRNYNLAFNPATGANYPFTDVTRRPYADFDLVPLRVTAEANNYHALQTSITKRFANQWQSRITYLLSGQWDLQRRPISPGCQYVWTFSAGGTPVCNVPIELAPDYRQEYFLSGAQRHRFVYNGIWDVGRGFQLSGLYLVADQGKLTPVSGVDVRDTGTTGGGRLRANGTFIARNGFDMPTMQRVDVRAQRRFRFGRAQVDGILEVFNLFNYKNYGSFVTNEASASFGQPAPNQNFAFWPRLMQLGFRVAF